MEPNEGASYRAFLKPGEQLPNSVVSVCQQLELQGALVMERVGGRGFRYECPCPRYHRIFVSPEALNYERLKFLLSRTCLKFE